MRQKGYYKIIHSLAVVVLLFGSFTSIQADEIDDALRLRREGKFLEAIELLKKSYDESLLLNPENQIARMNRSVLPGETGNTKRPSMISPELKRSNRVMPRRRSCANSSKERDFPNNAHSNVVDNGPFDLILAATGMKNIAVIIGAMKCGTTSLYNYLIQHPEICPCKIKESHFFNRDEEYNKGMEYYRNLWDFDEKRHKSALEASVGYTMKHMFPETAERLAKAPFDFKFIYIMRDPIERIESHHAHSLRGGWIDHPISEGPTRHAIETTKYFSQLKEYYDRFPAENILLLDFNEMKADASGIMKKIARFLGLDETFYDYSFESYNTHSAGNSRLYQRLRKVSLVQKMARVFPEGAKSRVLKTLVKVTGEKVKKEDYTLSKDQIGEIIAELMPDLESLRVEHNFDISKWKYIQ